MGQYLSFVLNRSEIDSTVNATHVECVEQQVKQKDHVVRVYGWIRDENIYDENIYDDDDNTYDDNSFETRCSPNCTSVEVIDTNTNIDLRDICPHVYSQGQLGSCSANAVAGLFECDEIKQGLKHPFTPSRLFIYYNERLIQGTTNQDSGARVSVSVKAVVDYGVCPEHEWPYDIAKFKDTPPDECYQTAQKHVCMKHRKIKQTLQQMIQCLASGLPYPRSEEAKPLCFAKQRGLPYPRSEEAKPLCFAKQRGLPFIFGINLYTSFDDVKNDGIVPMPDLSKEVIIGGHVMMCAGYDFVNKWFIVRNSWGVEWGDKGYCYIPEDYMLNNDMTSDYWTIQRIHNS
jgi:C1A family cysteine protease